MGKLIDVTLAITFIGCTAFAIYIVSQLFSGSGSLQSIVTIRGVYTVEKPDGYQAVCFVNAKSGGISCLPLKDVVSSAN